MIREEGKLSGTGRTMEASDSGGCAEDESGEQRRRKVERHSKTMATSDCGDYTEDELRRAGLDFTERLPDDLVVKLLSGFTLKEAARTCVLARRWRDLWKSADLSVMDFDGMKEVRGFTGGQPGDKKLITKKRVRYMKWVNQVLTHLQQHNNMASKFRFAFNLTNDCNSEGDIDRWLLFAMSKRVESLDLSLDSTGVSNTMEAYVFSEDCFNHMKTPVGLSNIKFLRSLRLLRVDVRGEILEFVVANCPSLEDLAVQSLTSGSLTQLRVVGSSYLPLRLKHLEVIGCEYLRYLEIEHAPQLIRFTYGLCDSMKEIRVGNCPHLVDMALIHVGPSPLFSLFGSLSGCASQLESLFFKNWAADGSMGWIADVAEHTRLKQLTLEVHGGRHSMLMLTCLINKCPSLHTLHVSLRLYTFSNSEKEFHPAPHAVKTCRESIKVVKIVGFNGYETEVEFVDYVMEYFVCLERIVIDPTRPDFVLANDLTLFGKPGGIWSLNEEQACKAKEVALKLKSKAAPTLEFIVI